MSNTTTQSKELGFVLERVKSWTSDYCLTQRWGNMRFTEMGATRMYSCLGYIAGIHAAGKTEDAERYAIELVQLFDRLNETSTEDREVSYYDGTVQVIKVPWNKFEIGADGCFMSFTFSRYVLMGTGETVGNGEKLFSTRPDYGDALYRASTFGGIIYHGPGSGETYTVTLDDDSRHLWGIHT